MGLCADLLKDREVKSVSSGTDIYTVSKILGHTDVKIKQIYAKVVDEKKEKAENAIKLNINNKIKK